MGEVYLGHDTRLDRMVALKCLRASADGGQHSRALYEARAAAQINHVNVATIHDVIDEGAQAYIVMEYVSGETLAARLRRGRVSIDEALAIGRQLTAALQAAHAVGVVHRDLKPANVQITAAGIVKVLDFGIARAAAPLPLSSAATETDRPDSDTRPLRAGTPAYMAPEQMLGARQRPPRRSLQPGRGDVRDGHRSASGTTRSTRSSCCALPETLARRATEIDKHVPSRLADTLEIALKCDPRHRFQSAGEFDAALEAMQIQRRRRWGRREWLAASAVGAGGLATVAWRGWRGGFPPGAAATSIAVLPFVNLSGDAAARVPRRRHDRRPDQRPRPHRRAQRQGSHVGHGVQGQQEAHRRDRARAARRCHRRGLGAAHGERRRHRSRRRDAGRAAEPGADVEHDPRARAAQRPRDLRRARAGDRQPDQGAG